MTSIIHFLTVICVATARVISDDSPYSFSQNTPAPPFDLNQGEVMMKDAILYLTPSQIKAYEASQGQENHDQISEEDIRNVEAEIKRQLERQNIFAIDQNNERPPKYPNQPPPVIEDPIREDPFKYSPQYQQKWIPMTKQQENQNFFIPHPKESQYNPHHKVAESYSYIKFFTDDKVHETPKLQLFHPIPQEQKVDPELAKFLEVQKDPLHHKQYRLIPYEYKTPTVPQFEEVKEITNIADFLEKYNNESQEPQVQEITEVPKDDAEKLQFQTDLSDFKYAPQFENRKPTNEEQKFLIKIEKENALARAQAILNASSNVGRKEINNKRRPIPIPTYLGKEKTNSNRRFFSSNTKREVPVNIPVQKSYRSPPHRHI